MNPELVEQLKYHKRGLAQLVVTIDPGNEDEWKAFDKVEAAHKLLRSIEFSKLGQLSMPMPAREPDVECPMCQGAKTIKDGTGQDAVCPRCQGKGFIPASQLSLDELDLKENETTDSKQEETAQNTDQEEEKPKHRGRPRKTNPVNLNET